ncbi:Solute carrier family 26 member 6 isoform X1 [Oopsacas minuta]|uniref:Solute carrier family 26 member 6 isoform X1 n=1 Tax=Oopsacas minuta TaxID=111878 RepID=A0AAV7K1U8_9METZ|nr:Solute carrier family 26 member 6 isoform X1 [Oopsacas minuta]
MDDDVFDGNSPQICINRTAYNAKTLDETYPPTPALSIPQQVKSLLKSHCRFDGACIGRFFLARFPIFKWIYSYRLRRYLLGDILSGTTVSMLHLPQGMAYALLALQHPVYGLYTSFLFSFIYPIFGTSRHASLGTFAVVALLTSNAIREIATVATISNSCSMNNFTNISRNSTLAFTPDVLERIAIASTLTFLIGCIFLIFGVLRLGFISNLLSRPFTRAYVAGAGVHVFVAQIDTLFGITICDVIPTIFKVPYQLYFIAEQIVMLRITWLSIVISIISIIVLYIVKFLDDFLQKKKFPFPIPVQLVLIVIFTIASYFAKFEANFGVEIVGYIPRGVPSFMLPNPSYFLPLLDNAIIITVVSYSTGISMIQVLADKHDYKVDANQELFANGMCNFISSFFFSIPGSVSFSRSLIQNGSGGKTQLASIFAGFIILLCLVAIAPLFESLPTPVLASTVVVALHGLYLHVLDLPFYWKISKYDLFIWIVTFLSTVIINVEIGLACGLVVSLIVFVVRTILVSPVLLGNLASSELYVNVKEFEDVTVKSSVKIIRHSSPLYFANASKLKNFIMEQLPNNPSAEVDLGCGPALYRGVQHLRNRKNNKHIQLEQINSFKNSESTTANITTPTTPQDNMFVNKFCVILDCSCIPFIDSVGGTTLCDINSCLTKKDYLFYLTGASRGLREDLIRASGQKWENILECIFPSIQDALSALKQPTKHPLVRITLNPCLIQHALVKHGARESSV